MARPAVEDRGKVIFTTRSMSIIQAMEELEISNYQDPMTILEEYFISALMW